MSHVEIDCDGKYVTKESGRYIPPKLVSGKKYWMLATGADDSGILSFPSKSWTEIVKVVYVGSLNEHEVFLRNDDRSQAVLLTDGDIRNFRVAAAYKQVTYVLCARTSDFQQKWSAAVIPTSEQVKKQTHHTDMTCSTVLQWYPSGNIPQGWTPLESNEKTRSTVEVDT